MGGCGTVVRLWPKVPILRRSTRRADVSFNRYLTAYATNATMLAQAVAAYPHRDVRFLLGTYDMCNCKTAGYANPHGDYCYPAAATCTTNTHGGSFEGRGCCDTYPDSNTSNALDVHCSALLQARGFYPGHYSPIVPTKAGPSAEPGPAFYCDLDLKLPGATCTLAVSPRSSLTLIRGATGYSAAATTCRTCNRSLQAPSWSTPRLPADTTTAAASSRTR